MYEQKVNKNIDNVKVSSTVRQLDLCNVIHSSTDVADGDILLLLNDYGINHNWTDEELELLREHLLEMALQEELKESERYDELMRDPLNSLIVFPKKQRKFKLVLGGFQIDEQIIDFIQNRIRTGILAIDLVDDHNDFKAGFQRLLEYKPGLRQGPL